MSLPKYPAYKDSGVAWLGAVPSHWHIVRVKDVASVINGYPFDSALFDEANGHPLLRIRDLNATEATVRYQGEYIEAAEVTSDDVLIGMDGDFNVGRWLGTEPALLNQRVCCIRTEEEVLSKFLFYALPTPLKEINDNTYATTVKHLSSLSIEKIRLAIPHGDELSTIAAFLDRETAKIDALIAEQEKLIALLAEKRQATISHAVTRGLDPAAPMKDSGVEWLGNIPTHWSLTRFKNALALKADIVGNRASEFLLLSLTLQGIIPRDLDNPQGKFPSSFDTYQTVSPGDIVFCLFDVEETPRGVGLCGLSGMLTGAYTVTYAKNGFHPDYLFYYYYARDQYKAWRMYYTGLRNVIRWDNFCNIPCIQPPIDEQVAIAKFLDQETSKINALISIQQEAIALLQERRAALIAAAVTGQIDVRGLVDAPASPAPEPA